MSESKVFPNSVQELVRGVDGLVSLPEVCFLVNDLVNDPNSDIDQIGNVISKDPALTLRLLKLVNSPMYGFEAKIETVSRAVLMIGLKELQNMVWATTAVETFAGLSANKVNMASFWRHSIFAAVLARILARECNVLHPERLFVAGLLHDIGRLVIYHRFPEQVDEIWAVENEHQLDDGVTAERLVLGFDHGELAAELLRHWGLSESLATAVQYHHNPRETKQHELEVSIVHMANVMAHALEIGDEEELDTACEAEAWALVGLETERIKPMLHEAIFQFLEVLELLLPGARQRL
ncbi:MAG: HDOD domain-containing protein [Gammaproteobacteria bacterium]|nr:HDOD domain-containing protein [Gammaproteobacteria bacterium]